MTSEHSVDRASVDRASVDRASVDRASVDRAGPADFLEIAALDRLAWPEVPDTFIPDGEHVWRVWCEHAWVWAARSSPASESSPASSELVGAAVAFPSTQDLWFLHKIMVHPERRGSGLGTALMRAVLAAADRPVVLTVDPQNERAVALYRRFGFEVDQHVEGYYRPHEHRNVMVYRPRPENR